MKSNLITVFKLIFAILLLNFTVKSHAQHLRAEGKFIVNQDGQRVVLRGMGLGGWMLQEGYMLRIPGNGQQYRIQERISDLIGEERTQQFYDAWLSNHTTKADIDSMKVWGFNSVRLPMHFNLFTPAIEDEPLKGQISWIDKGFEMTDSLLKWCQDNEIYLILDLHAAPGGQGNDFNISDRNPNLPSLWDSPENQQKMVALWRKLAERYKDEPWIGGYDIINEPNWGFTDPEDKNGLQEKLNVPLRKLLIDVTEAIREVDKTHMIFIEGNGWGNNYNGIFPLWDDNLVVSFHKYWNYNTQGSIQQFLDYRDKYNVPIWLGETGENSNTWFTDAISLLEGNEVGWCWWPLKKMGINNPLEVKVTSEYLNILEYWDGDAPKPDPEIAYHTLMKMAENTNIKHNRIHYDVIDAMFRQVSSKGTKPFRLHSIGKSIQAVDYDLGKNNEAYYDTDIAEYYISTGTDRTGWNMGRAYRNEGVDIYKSADEYYYVGKIEKGEWLTYTVNADKTKEYQFHLMAAGLQAGASLILSINGKEYSSITIPKTGNPESWQIVELKSVSLKEGDNSVRIFAEHGGFNLKSFKFIP